MAFFFNGRLWVSPAVMSVVDDSALYNPNQTVGNVLALVGRSTGGAPGVPLKYGSPAEAVAALVSGDLVDAITRAFDPSSETAGPSTIIAMRVNPAVQSTLTLLDSSLNPVINLASSDYGQRTAQIKVKVEAGSTARVPPSTPPRHTSHIPT